MRPSQKTWKDPEFLRYYSRPSRKGGVGGAVVLVVSRMVYPFLRQSLRHGQRQGGAGAPGAGRCHGPNTVAGGRWDYVNRTALRTYKTRHFSCTVTCNVCYTPRCELIEGGPTERCSAPPSLNTVQLNRS
jgi:hypothetical protein